MNDVARRSDIWLLLALVVGLCELVGEVGRRGR